MTKPNASHLAGIHRLKSLADQLCKITHFSSDECKSLLALHQRLESVGPLDRMRMREVLHVIFAITDDVMLDLAFKAFDRDGDNYVDDVEFLQGLSTMLRGSLEELTDWCYYIYDMNGDGGLAREELSHCLKGCILPGYGIEHDEIEDCERDIVEIAMKKLDVDKDGQITQEDFKHAIRHDPLMLVSVGPCLPPARHCATFLSLFTESFRSYTMGSGKSKKWKQAHSRYLDPFNVNPRTSKLNSFGSPTSIPAINQDTRIRFQEINKAKRKSMSIVNVHEHKHKLENANPLYEQLNVSHLLRV